MKILLCLTLLGAALLGNVFVFGQGRTPGDGQLPRGLELGQTLPGYIKPPMVFKVLPGRPYSPGTPYLSGKPYKGQLFARAGDSVRILSPDRMPCVVADLSWMERMPVQRSRNREPMPNMMARKPMVRVIAFPGGQK